MRNGIFGFFVFCIVGASPLAAQSIPLEEIQKEEPASVPVAPTPATISPDYTMAPAETMEDNCCYPPLRFWASGEYLMWWIKNAPQPVPLVTVNNTGNAPTLGQPGTQVLYGGSSQDMGTFSGWRIGAGWWFGPDSRFGIEGSGFLLPNRTKTFRAGSDANGNPPFGISFLNPDGSENALTFTVPGLFQGNVAIQNSSQLWGAEANGVWNVCRNGSWDLSLLGGFRYMNLKEALRLDVNLNAGPAGFPDFTISASDSFRTRNQFYGGQVGARVGHRWGPLSAELTGKVALGSNHQSIDISGGLRNNTPFVPVGTFPGGAFALPSNIGHQARDRFAVIPEVQLKVGYDVAKWMRVTVGYDFLYWNDVVRPGDQIDRTLNRSQTFGGLLVGDARPAPLFNASDFWAHGVSFGVELRY